MPVPKLRRYVGGSGYYLKDYLHGAGHCTWQIGDEGIAYLRQRGVKADGDWVGPRDRNELRARGWIWLTGEGGRSHLPDGALVLPAELRTLAEDLARWATQGGLHALQGVLHGRHGDQRERCFSAGFLKWLARLDPGRLLADLDAISAPDFDDLAAPDLDRLNDPLHAFFARRGDTHVLWQLAQVVGLVARQRRGNSTCPVRWERDYSVLQRLFWLLDRLTLPADPDKEGRTRQRRPGRSALRVRPLIVWGVEAQEVVAVLPEQTLSPDVLGIAWQVSPGDAPPPQHWRESDGQRVEETRSQPLLPAPAYRIETHLRFQSGHPSCDDRVVVGLPDDPPSWVLFAPEGTLLGCEEGSLLSVGEYLALVRKEAAEQLLRRRGVTGEERIPFTPVGWHGWQGWRLQLAAGADVAPYVVENATTTAWELEQPPASEVVWRERLPVYVGHWPRIYISDPGAFAGAVLEVAHEPYGHVAHLLPVGEPGGIPLSSDGEQAFLDLPAAGALAGCHGTLRLTCRPPVRPDASPLVARLVRVGGEVG
jgi:hypothetical protein